MSHLSFVLEWAGHQIGNRLRAFLFAALGILAGFLASSAMPEPAGISFFVVFTSGTGFGIVSFLGGCLIKKEFGEVLKDQSGSAAQ